MKREKKNQTAISHILRFLFLCVIHGDLFSSAQGRMHSSDIPIRIPVVPDEKTEPLTEPQTSKNSGFKSAVDAVNSPHREVVNAEENFPQSEKGSHSQARSVSGTLSQLRSATVMRYGGENGVSNVRLRGARAFEPSYFIEGVALTGILRGSQILDIFPANFMGALKVYPDSPPFWLTNTGIGGAINFESCEQKTCFPSQGVEDTSFSSRASLKFGSYNYRQGSAVASLNLSENTNFLIASEFTKSSENYSVKNNANTISRKDDDFYETRKNNDFSRTSFGVVVDVKNSPFFGKAKVTFLGGNETRGIPQAVGGTGDHLRLTTQALLLSASSYRLFPSTGVELESQLFGKFDSAKSYGQKLQSLSIIPAQASSNGVGLRGKVSLPSRLILDGYYSLSASASMDQFDAKSDPTETGAGTGSQSNGRRQSLNIGLGRSFVQEFNENFALSLDLSGKSQNTLNRSLVSCDRVQKIPNCGKSLSTSEPPTWDYTASLQLKTPWLVPFVRTALNQRQPFFIERYGSPGGILSNSSLRNETSTKTELGIITKFGEGGFFWARDKNLIFLEKISAVSTQYQNLESGNRLGGYLNGSSVFKSITLDANYQYLISKIFRKNVGDVFLPRSPEHTLSLGGLISLPQLAVGDAQVSHQVFARGIKQSSIYLETANLIQLDMPWQTQAGYKATLALAKGTLIKRIMISIEGDNLSNDLTASQSDITGSVINVEHNGFEGFPPPGKRFYLTLSAEI